jgi:hypothetical protein
VRLVDQAAMNNHAAELTELSQVILAADKKVGD